MITQRDLLIGVASVLAGAAIVSLAQSAGKPIMRSSVFNWDNLQVEATKSGERRSVFDAPTRTVEELECHITTLNPGQASHPAHRHPEEEVMIIREGTLESVQNGRTNRVEAGGIIFEAANELHGVRNIGAGRATYYVFKWVPHDLAR
jgi:quercetin dioxygenase-like cupin family protein